MSTVFVNYINENAGALSPQEWVYNDVQYPPNIFYTGSDEELIAIGIYRAYNNTPTPDGKLISYYNFSIEEGVGVATPVFADIPPPPPIPVPQIVSKAQGKAALLLNGYYDDVINYIEQIADPTEKRMAQFAFNDTTDWNRQSPFLTQMASLLGMAETDLDNLFIQAAGLIL